MLASHDKRTDARDDSSSINDKADGSPTNKKIKMAPRDKSETSGGEDDDSPPPPVATKGPALVFGASGAQGRAVMTGLVDAGYRTFGATRNTHTDQAVFATDALGCTLLEADLTDRTSVERALSESGATSIFLVTTTDLPSVVGSMNGFQAAEDAEYETIVDFFDAVCKAHEADGIERHVVFSTLDNVKRISEEVWTVPAEGGENGPGLVVEEVEAGSGAETAERKPWIHALKDGSVAAHYSGKGRAGEYATQLLEGVDGVSLTLITLPFLHSNFVGFFVPLPNEGGTQWQISACFGEDSAIDMFSVTDLAYIVPEVMDEKEIYKGKNLRISAERITMEEVASIFSDLFGKDVIYNPLTPEEMTALTIPSAGCMAQMCQFLGDKRSLHQIDVTEAVMFPRKPQLFKDWLLINSDHKAFEEVGLSVDAKEILSVTVFGATGLQGTSVVKGLLADSRKQYTIRATTRDISSSKAQALLALDPKRISLVQADFDNVKSLAAAVDGIDGAFLVTDFFGGANMDPEVEERHARNVIDACEASHSVRHLVFSTMESVEEMNQKLKLGLTDIEDEQGRKGTLPQFDAKARAASYARTKKLSVTYVLMPCYSEMFFDLIKPEQHVDDTTGQKKTVITVPLNDDTKVMCMSVEDLGPAVASIFDSYQVYAGHEIGLVTDFVSVSEASDIITDVLLSGEDGSKKASTGIEKKEVPMENFVQARGTYIKDLGQIFKYMSHTDAVKKRRSVAKTMKLVPSAKNLRQWVEHNKDNVAFREKLGLR